VRKDGRRAFFVNSNENPVTTNIPTFVVKAGKDRIGGTLHVFDAQISVKISSHDTRGAFAVMETSTPPKSGPPLHLHQREDEWWYILDGNFLFEDGNTFHAGPGDTVFAPRRTRHTFQNVGTVPGRALVTVVPGGFEMFFQEISAAVLPGARLDPVVILPIFQKYGLEFLGPPLNKR